MLMMEKFNLINVLQPIIQALDDLKIPYYLSGSVASSVYGIPRTTLDIDLVTSLNEVSIEKFVERIKSNFFVDKEMILDAIKTNSSFNIIHLDSMIKVDLFILKKNRYSLTAFDRKRIEKLTLDDNSIEISICSSEDIILNKLIWFKEGNMTSERQWLDILGVLKIQFNSLDKDYLKFWAKELQIDDLLKKAFTESGIE